MMEGHAQIYRRESAVRGDYRGIRRSWLPGHRNPGDRDATAALMPNLVNAAGVIAAHQNAGQLSAGDPLHKLVNLIAPLLVFGLWERTGATPVVPDIDAHTLVAEFLDGHRAH